MAISSDLPFQSSRTTEWTCGVPEVRGPIDPGSEAHDLVMTLFGGMSKGERNRIQVRTRAAMMDLAARTDRFLGGA